MEKETFSHTITNGKVRMKRVWFVKRLIDLSQHLPIKEIEIAKISSFYQIKWFSFSKTNEPTCKAIADHMKRILEVPTSMPIILASNGNVMDGMHRICKAYILGMKTIHAVQFIEDPLPDSETTSDESHAVPAP